MASPKIWTRDFVLSFFAQAAFSSVFFILIPTIPIYLKQLGTEEAGIGVLVGAVSVSSLVLRPFIGRALLISFPMLFVVCSILSLVSLLITLKLKSEEKIVSVKEPLRPQPLFSRQALGPALMAFMGSAIWGVVTAFFPLYALLHGVSNPGLFFGALTVILISAGGLGGKIFDLYPREKILMPRLASQVIAMAFLAFSKNLPMFLQVALIWGLGNAFLYPILVAYAIDLAGSFHGPTIGTYTAFSDFRAGIGASIMGVVLQLTNYPVMLLCLALTAIKRRKRDAHL